MKGAQDERNERENAKDSDRFNSSEKNSPNELDKITGINEYNN